MRRYRAQGDVVAGLFGRLVDTLYEVAVEGMFDPEDNAEQS